MENERYMKLPFSDYIRTFWENTVYTISLEKSTGVSEPPRPPSVQYLPTAIAGG